VEEKALAADFEPEPFRAGLAERERKRRADVEERAGRAREFLAKIRDAFIDIDPDIRTIVLFGSLARGIPRRGNFDIDIGVRSTRYLGLVSWALDQQMKKAASGS
jgi:predicted nucleotidyltransferase